MKELKLNISPFYVDAEWLEDISCYNDNYYKIESHGGACCFHYPFNIIQEICHEDEGYYEYNLGYFEGKEFVEVFSWTSEYGADSIFGEKQNGGGRK